MRILFITPRFPYPPLRGYQLRAHHQLRLLNVNHQVTLVCFSGADESPETEKAKQYCCEVIAVPYRPATMIASLCAGFLRGRPIQSAFHETSAMRRVIARVLSERRHDLVHVQLSRMAGLLEETTPIPRVIDFVDALSLNLQRRAAYDRVPINLVARAEASRQLRYEREVCRTWDRAMVVSAVDRAAIGDFPNLGVNPSGVDLEAFPYRGEGREESTIVFSGNLGYFSNIDAISWFAREIFPRIVSAAPDAKLQIVGARPSRNVRALARLDPRIRITGMVDLLQPYLQRCGVAIAPMRAGSGQLFKMLEAMASGAPLVATSRAAEATGAESGRHLLVANDAESFAASVLHLIHERALAASVAQAARQLVESRYRWESSVAELEESYRLATKGRNRADQSAAV